MPKSNFSELSVKIFDKHESAESVGDDEEGEIVVSYRANVETDTIHSSHVRSSWASSMRAK